MNRTRRWLFTTTAALSLLLALSIAALWISTAFRDLFVAYSFPRDPQGKFWQLTLASTGGRIALWKEDLPANSFPEAFAFTHGINAPTHYGWPWLFGTAKLTGFGLVSQNGFGLLGFYCYRATYTGPMLESMIAVPDPLFLILFLLLPIRWLKTARPQPPGRCQTCGYDLRATPDRCPECGKIPQKTA